MPDTDTHVEQLRRHFKNLHWLLEGADFKHSDVVREVRSIIAVCNLLTIELTKVEIERDRLKAFCDEFVWGEDNPDEYRTQHEELTEAKAMVEVAIEELVKDRNCGLFQQVIMPPDFESKFQERLKAPWRDYPGLVTPQPGNKECRVAIWRAWIIQQVREGE